MVNTLKDYAIKAVVNTVDHLGSVSYKVGDFLDEKVDEVSGTELRVSCIEQVKSFVLSLLFVLASSCYNSVDFLRELERARTILIARVSLSNHW